MMHPDSKLPRDPRPLHVGELLVNPKSKERGKLIELPYMNAQRLLVAELDALVGAKVVGEHMHPVLTERFTVIEGELTLKCNGKITILRAGQSATIEPGVWHDWWNAGKVNAIARVEVTPGDRFMHMIETLWGLARLGYTDNAGMPNLLQLALFASEFDDVLILRSPPFFVQRLVFTALAPLARWLGYRATYPELSRSLNSPVPDA